MGIRTVHMGAYLSLYCGVLLCSEQFLCAFELECLLQHMWSKLNIQQSAQCVHVCGWGLRIIYYVDQILVYVMDISTTSVQKRGTHCAGCCIHRQVYICVCVCVDSVLPPCNSTRRLDHVHPRAYWVDNYFTLYITYSIVFIYLLKAS